MNARAEEVDGVAVCLSTVLHIGQSLLYGTAVSRLVAGQALQHVCFWETMYDTRRFGLG